MKKSELKNYIKEVVECLLQDPLYMSLKTDTDRNIYESYIFICEFMNPDNSYPYKQKIKGLYTFTDEFGYTMFVRITYQPTVDPYWEIKFGWADTETPEQKYDSQPERPIDQRRSDTIAKIYRDELIPLFKQQTASDTLYLLPIDEARYKFAEFLVNNFTPKDLTVIKNQPKNIIIKK